MTSTAPPTPSIKHAVPPTANSDTSTAGNSPPQQEDSSTVRLRQAWRSFASTIVVAERTADKAPDANSKELDEAVVSLLKTRIHFRRMVNQLEARLAGQVQETEALEGCIRSQPSVGRKRKCGGGDSASNGQSSSASTIATPP